MFIMCSLPIRSPKLPLFCFTKLSCIPALPPITVNNLYLHLKAYVINVTELFIRERGELISEVNHLHLLQSREYASQTYHGRVIAYQIRVYIVREIEGKYCYLSDRDR